MVTTIEGNFAAGDKKFAIVASRFNDFITEKILAGAIDMLKRHGVAEDSITVAWVPGAFDLPLVARKMAASGHYDALIALGCVIRGATTHYDYVAGGAAKGIAQVSLETGVPIVFGVLTTENIEQAIERAGTKSGNKGADASLAALELANLMGQL